MEAVTNFDQLTSKLNEAEEMQSVSDDAVRKSLSAWYLSPHVFGKAPEDPLSPEFRAFQLEIYERLTNDAYEVTNEETVFDFDHELLWPYPYGTRSAQTVGTHLLGYGWLIKVLDLPAGSRILEIGSGYGTLTVHLARMGYEVTCLDISAQLLNFIKARTVDFPQQVSTICGDMATVEIDDTFDAVIFNASLHHSLQHKAVIQRLDALLNPDGIAAFVAEPVVGVDSLVVPYPWGIRLDGLSVYSISKHGWLELGFQEPYFVKMLEDANWKLTRQHLGTTGHADIWIASKTGRHSAFSTVKFSSTEQLNAEITRLRGQVEGYENGRFMRLMKWLKDFS